MRNKILCFFFLLGFAINSNAQSKKAPTFEDVLSLYSISNPEISPNGNHILFQKQTTDWKKNRYDTEIWIAESGADPIPLTNNPKGSSTNPKWSPNGKWIAFLSKRGEKTQIHLICSIAGEAMQLTNTESNISNFEWSPDGKKKFYGLESRGLYFRFFDYQF